MSVTLNDFVQDYDPIAEALRNADKEVTAVPMEVVPLAQAAHSTKGPRTEKPVHRVMAMLYAKGVAPSEIARQTDYSVVQVRSVLRAPHMRKLIAEFVHSDFDEGPMALLQSGVVDAIETLKELCTSTTVPASVRRASARDILEMANPKRLTTLSPQDIINQLDKERDDNE